MRTRADAVPATLTLLLVAGCGGDTPAEPATSGQGEAAGAPASAGDAATRARLERFVARVEREVVQVSDSVFVALGYTHSANAVIVGPEGLVVIDPGHDVEASRDVRVAFEQLSDLPVRALIYTHGHGDHTGGAAAFVDPESDVAIWARANHGAELREAAAAGLRGWVRPAISQGGDLRDDQLFLFNGPLRPEMPGKMTGRGRTLEPTDTFDGERVALELAGVQLELVAAPGETEDQLYVWMPSERVLFAGDNVLHSWPNVYSIRGSGRDVRAWIASLSAMITEDPERLVSGHGLPLLEGVVPALQNRRDALQWVLDRTVEGVNRGLTADEVVALVRLPEPWASLDYLADYYGSLEYTVRHLVSELVGWFDGDPLELYREHPVARARRAAALVGGEQALLERAREALAEGDALGAAQLAQHATRLLPCQAAPAGLLAEALEALAEGQLNLPARYYTLSCARRLRQKARAAEGGPGK